jgi:hypothetical protein
MIDEEYIVDNTDSWKKGYIGDGNLGGDIYSYLHIRGADIN